MFPGQVTSSLKPKGLSHIIQGNVYRDSSWERGRESHSRENSLEDREGSATKSY